MTLWMRLMLLACMISERIGKERKQNGPLGNVFGICNRRYCSNNKSKLHFKGS